MHAWLRICGVVKAVFMFYLGELVQYFDNIEQTCTIFDSSFHHSLLSADDLRDYFEKFGKISDATVKTDPATGRSKGFGFVVFVDPATVDEVLLTGFGLFWLV